MLALAAALTGAFAHLPALAQEVAQDTAQKAPEVATAYAEKAGWAAKKYMVAAANPLAVEAGYQMLKKGGSAIDAAIATQLVLTLVEPQSSGIGGGAFLMYYDGKQVQAFDGRETAPASRPTNTCSSIPTARPLSRVGRRGRRPLGRRAGRAAHARTGAQAARQAAVEDAVRAGHQAVRARLRGQPAPERPADVGPAHPQGPGRRRLFLRRRHAAAADRLPAEKPGAGQDPARNRRTAAPTPSTRATSRATSPPRWRPTRPIRAS